jgi:hypothetical protein
MAVDDAALSHALSQQGGVALQLGVKLVERGISFRQAQAWLGQQLSMSEML